MILRLSLESREQVRKVGNKRKSWEQARRVGNKREEYKGTSDKSQIFTTGIEINDMLIVNHLMAFALKLFVVSMRVRHDG